MNNCSNLIDNTSLELKNFCMLECKPSIIYNCYCNCIKHYHDNDNDNDNDTYNDDYVLYDSTILSYIFFSILLFLCCICNICCFISYKNRINNTIKYINKINENNNINEQNNLISQQPPDYDSITIDLD